MKIKDLSSLNQVAGEGILRWSIQNTHGASVIIELMGYHIPNAEVRLLSPQVLLNTIGGKAIQTVQGHRHHPQQWFQRKCKILSTK
jgi:hypothetical protein